MIAAPALPLSKYLPAWRLPAGVRACLPFVFLLAWTCVVRLPFAGQSDEDEFFYAVVGARWLHGFVPYTASFDIKPPGLFAIFALVEAVFGHSLAMIKGLETVFTALGAFTLYRLMNRHVSQMSALWAAGLYPVYSLTLSGVSAVNMLIQLPFFIMAFEAALSAVRCQREARPALSAIFLAGLWVGGAGMIKQTALFEAVAICGLLLIYMPPRRWPVVGTIFALGAALPALGFDLYFLVTGHFQDMFDSVIRLAMARTSSDVVAGYGEKYSFYLTPFGAALNGLFLSVSLIVLWAGALLAVLRRGRFKGLVPDAVMSAAGLWLLAALIEVVAGRALCSYYMLSFVPPLLVLAAITIAHGLDIPDARKTWVWPIIACAAIVLPVAIERDTLFNPKAHLTDYQGTQAVARQLQAIGLQPQDRVLVLNRGYNIYLETGAQPPTRYFHSTHFMTAFHTPSADALGENLAARPRFIIVANPDLRALDESAARYDQALIEVRQHYSLAGQVSGQCDSFRIYERIAGS
ncbi:MAG: glycosyltransferase family 39 protein [Asticcacaulis sp.]|uniref:ArnT family glycosyltransferase n=1 Tax=Asticcacaulis sp. TaxID=1872648 RepID=UPI0039E5F302